jgi:hypothetical protein
MKVVFYQNVISLFSISSVIFLLEYIADFEDQRLHVINKSMSNRGFVASFLLIIVLFQVSCIHFAERIHA